MDMSTLISPSRALWEVSQNWRRSCYEAAVRMGSVADTDTAAEPNLVLRWRGLAMSTELGLPEDTQPIIDGLEACERAATWVASSPSCLRSAVE